MVDGSLGSIGECDDAWGRTLCGPWLGVTDAGGIPRHYPAIPPASALTGWAGTVS